MGRRQKASKSQTQAEPQQEDFFAMAVEGATGPPQSASKVPSTAEDQSFPVPCTFSAFGAALSGGALGFVFGFGQQVLKHKGKGRLKASSGEGISSAQSFAACTGIYSLVSCVTQRLRQTNDAWNGAAGGCASGLVLGWGGGLQSVLSSCLIAGVLSYFVSANEATAKQKSLHGITQAGANSTLLPVQHLGFRQPCLGVCSVDTIRGRRAQQQHIQLQQLSASTPQAVRICIACNPDPLTALLAAPWQHLHTAIGQYFL